MKYTDIVELKSLIVMFKASTNTLTNNIQKLFNYRRKKNVSGKKLELIENRFVF